MYPLVVKISESLPNPGPYWSLCLADAVHRGLMFDTPVIDKKNVRII